jgi:hypothetical protein
MSFGTPGPTGVSVPGIIAGQYSALPHGVTLG